MPSLVLFYRLVFRPLWREPIRTGLTVLAVALGVSVVLAIDLAGDAAAGSFHSSLETLVGDSNLEITATGGVPESVLTTLATASEPIRARPRIEDYATLQPSGRVVPLLGLDLVGESNDRELKQEYRAREPVDLLNPNEFFNDKDSIFAASSLGYKTGQAVSVVVNDQTKQFVVKGVFDDSGDGNSAIIMDIGAAQQLLNRAGRLDRILIRVPAEPAIAVWQKRLVAYLPSGVSIAAQGTGKQQNRRMLEAFRWNLKLLSYIALVVGGFLIYNTVSVSVVRRRPEIGIARALGASRTMIMAGFLLEAVVLGTIGAVLGIPIGRVMASGAVRLLGGTVDALYVTSKPGVIELSGASYLLALAVGLTVAVFSALSPAREASLVAPVEAMASARREFIARVHRKKDFAIALALAAMGTAAACLPPVLGKPLFGYLSAVFFIGSLGLATPLLVHSVTALSSNLLGRMLGVEALLAARSLAASLRRTSVLVGALATAIAMMVAVAIMVGSFRQTVVTWMSEQLPADLYLRPAGDAAADRHPTIAPSFVEQLYTLNGVANVDRFRAYEVSYEGLPAEFASADLIVTPGTEASGYVSGRSDQDVFAELREANSAIISEPFSNKHHLRAGAFVSLPLAGRTVNFRIVDVYYDYSSERGTIFVDRNTMLKYLPDPAPSNIAISVKPNASVQAVRIEIEKAAAGRNIVIFSDGELRREAIKIFDRTFAITYALEAVAILVAVIGIAGALLSMVIDRRRELGLLRFLGAATGQIRRLILTEAGLLGLLSNLAGLGLGIVLSLILILVINRQSFGWTIQFHWPVMVLLGALTGVYAATLLMGIYPARVASRLNPIEVVHEE